MKLKQFTLLGVLIALILFVGQRLLSVMSKPISPPTPLRETHTFQASSLASPLLNPERGFYLPMDLIGTENFGGVRTAGYTLIRSYVRLDAYREQDLPQNFLDDLDKGLNAVRAGGIKVILRFSYNFGPYPNSEPDASKDQILRHIAQLAPTFQKHGDVIAWLEAGFVGAWGEWHTSTHGIDKSPSDKREIVSALLKALPPSRMIQLRYPTDLIRMFPEPLTEQAAFNDSEQARIGHHNDCFLKSNTDEGTYEREGTNTRKSDQKYLAQSTRYTVVGGETCGEDTSANPPLTDCETTLKEMALLHFTEINLSFHPQVVRNWKKQGCFDEISARLGYRLVLNNATVSTSAVRGDNLYLSLEIENKGFAAPANPHPLYLVLDGPQRVLLPLPHLDVRHWGAGYLLQNSMPVLLPRDMPAGQYRVALWLPDATESLRNNADYSIRFANENIWDEENGFNVIANQIKIE